MKISFASDDAYAGFGASHGLSRGLLVLRDGKNITSEGMGIGAPALNTGGVTYFASLMETSSLEHGVITKRFAFDKVQSWSIFSRPSEALSRAIRVVNRVYMSHPLLQKTLLRPDTGLALCNLLSIRHSYKRTKSMGEASFAYAIDGDSVRVTCSIFPGCGSGWRAFIMNEIGAEHVDSSLRGARTSAPPSGWESLDCDPGRVSLCDSRTGLRFRVSEVKPGDCPGIKTDMNWGMEKSARLSWAGFQITITQPGTGSAGLEYTVDFGGSA